MQESPERVRVDVKPEATIRDLAYWLLTESEDEETAFLITAMGKVWSPVDVVETFHEDEGRPGWQIVWEPYPETDPPRAREFARYLLKAAPPWQPVVMEFAEDRLCALQWPGVAANLGDDLPAIVLDLSQEAV